MVMPALPDNTYNFSQYLQSAICQPLETAWNNATKLNDKQYVDWYYPPVEEKSNSHSYLFNTSHATHFQSCVADAIDRYKRLNKAETYDITAAKPFLSALNCLYPVLPVITFFDDSVKARFTFNHTEFVVDYDFEESEPVYVSAYKNDLLVFKTCSLEKLKETLEQF
jgi:hypothetical protein